MSIEYTICSVSLDHLFQGRYHPVSEFSRPAAGAPTPSPQDVRYTCTVRYMNKYYPSYMVTKTSSVQFNLREKIHHKS